MPKDGEEAVKDLRLIDVIYLAAKTGKKVEVCGLTGLGWSAFNLARECSAKAVSAEFSCPADG